MNIDVSLIYKIFSAIKTIFWRNAKIIYINSNKKIQSKESIDLLTGTKNYHWINCQSHFKGGFKLKNYKFHLLRMKRHLYDISRNLDETNCLTYSGFVSPMFAAYDGFCLGDNINYSFIDCDSGNSTAYKINYSKNLKETPALEKPSTKLVNVLFCCGHEINIFNTNLTTYWFRHKFVNRLTQSYLHEVYTFANAVFELCKDSGVERINLYIAAKQPISFVIGTAIQTCYPNIFVYEMVGNEYKYAMCIQTGKLEVV